MYWEMTGDRGDKWLNGVLPIWSVAPFKVGNGSFLLCQLTLADRGNVFPAVDLFWVTVINSYKRRG